MPPMLYLACPAAIIFLGLSIMIAGKAPAQIFHRHRSFFTSLWLRLPQAPSTRFNPTNANSFLASALPQKASPWPQGTRRSFELCYKHVTGHVRSRADMTCQDFVNSEWAFVGRNCTPPWCRGSLADIPWFSGWMHPYLLQKLHFYNAPAARNCVRNRTVLFVGDSTMFELLSNLQFLLAGDHLHGLSLWRVWVGAETFCRSRAIGWVEHDQAQKNDTLVNLQIPTLLKRAQVGGCRASQWILEPRFLQELNGYLKRLKPHVLVIGTSVHDFCESSNHVHKFTLRFFCPLGCREAFMKRIAKVAQLFRNITDALGVPVLWLSMVLPLGWHSEHALKQRWYPKHPDALNLATEFDHIAAQAVRSAGLHFINTSEIFDLYRFSGLELTKADTHFLLMREYLRNYTLDLAGMRVQWLLNELCPMFARGEADPGHPPFTTTLGPINTAKINRIKCRKRRVVAAADLSLDDAARASSSGDKKLNTSGERLALPSPLN